VGVAHGLVSGPRARTCANSQKRHSCTPALQHYCSTGWMALAWRGYFFSKLSGDGTCAYYSRNRFVLHTSSTRERRCFRCFERSIEAPRDSRMFLGQLWKPNGPFWRQKRYRKMARSRRVETRDLHWIDCGFRLTFTLCRSFNLHVI
jgi:hypothetical protein